MGGGGEGTVVDMADIGRIFAIDGVCEDGRGQGLMTRVLKGLSELDGHYGREGMTDLVRFFVFERGYYERRELMSRVLKGPSKSSGHYVRHYVSGSDFPRLTEFPTGAGTGINV